MKRQRDFQKTAVYVAETPLRDLCSQFVSVSECQKYVDNVLSSTWWKSRSNTKSIFVADGRGRRRAAAWFRLGRIALPRWARNEVVILHELAHILVYGVYGERADEMPSHGKEFCHLFILLIEEFVSCEMAKKIKGRFTLANVKFE